MGKPVEADAQFKAARDAGIPVITVQSGTGPYSLFDIQTNEYKVGADAALYLAGLMGYKGNLLSVRFEANVASRSRGRLLDVILAENQGIREVAKFSMARTQSWQNDVRNGTQALLLQNQGRINGIWASFDGQGLYHRRPAARPGRQERPDPAGLRPTAAWKASAASPIRKAVHGRPSAFRLRIWG